jgi:hypothetical protein
MSALLEACARVLPSGRRNPVATPPERAATMKVAEKLGGVATPSEKPRSDKDYNEIATRIQDKLRHGVPLEAREVRDAAWCLWQTDPALASDERVLNVLLPAWEASDKRRGFRAMASSYVAAYAADLPGIEAVARGLSRQANRWGRPWDRLQEELDIFGVGAGPRALGRAAIKRNASVVDVLKEYGLGAVDAQSGLAKAAADEILIALSEDVSGDHEGRLRQVQRFALRPDNKLVFADQGLLVAKALLNPLRGQSPAKPTRDLFLRVIIALFGDPRLSPGRWNSMRDLEEMVRRWFTEQSLRQFLDIVDRVAVEHMWKYRRAFWEAIFGAGLIDEAWVVFADQGARLARDRFGPEASFGRFDSYGSKQLDPGHAVLLLRIGRGVVADWSHNGKCDIWSDAESRNAPKLYAKTYNSDQVRIGRGTGTIDTRDLFSVAHVWSETYNWQTKVADRIHRMTGHRIPQISYSVR